MSTTVFPQQGDSITQAAWTGTNTVLRAGSHGVVSGFDLSDAGAGTVSASAGTAFVSGFSVVTDGAITKALSNGTPRYLWLTTSGTLAESANDTAPNGNDLFLGHVVVAGGVITSLHGHYFVAADTGQDDIMIAGRKPLIYNLSIAANLNTTNVAQVVLAPGLWLVRVLWRPQGAASSGGQAVNVGWFSLSGATSSSLKIGYFTYNNMGSTPFSTTAAAYVAMTTANNNDPHPIRAVAIVDAPDGGTLSVGCQTGSQHSLSNGGYLAATRIS